MRLSDALCTEARTLIANRLGLDFPKQRQSDLERGLSRALAGSSISDPETYLARMASLPDESPEWGRLAGELTVGETYFFRDRACFDVLEQQVLPPLIATRRSDGIFRLRLWSAACATGEEPYSLAILLDRMLPDYSEWAVTILATDINPKALLTARRGVYREWSLRDTPQWIRDRYFQRTGRESFELDSRIRRMVCFAPLNLAANAYPTPLTNTSGMDLILCRNVLMYFIPDVRWATVGRLQRALLRGGWLAVSPSEACADLFHPLVSLNFAGAILYRNAEASVARVPARWQSESDLPSLAESPGSSHTWSDLIPPQPPSAPLAVAEQADASSEPVPDIHRARILADQGNLEQALHLCETVLARDRLDPEAYLLLAAICQERGEIPAAVRALRRAIYLAPDCAPAYFLLGGLLLQQGERRQGRRCMETVVGLLDSAPRDEAVAGSDGLTAGRLLETTRAYLELSQ